MSGRGYCKRCIYLLRYHGCTDLYDLMTTQEQRELCQRDPAAVSFDGSPGRFR